MRRPVVSLLIVLALLVGRDVAHASHTPASPAAAPPDAAADTRSPEAVVRAFYASGSGVPGVRHDWSRFRALFLPGARLVAVLRDRDGRPMPRDQSVEDYIVAATPTIETRGFRERPLGARTERYGDLVHVWSAYEATHGVGADARVVTGINSLQMVFREGRWWIAAVAWTNDRAAGPLEPALATPPAG